MSKDAYYFPHDTNAIQDPKMMKLLFSCGVEAIGLYWIIIEVLHQQENGRLARDEYESYVDFYSKWSRSENMANAKQMLVTCQLLLESDGFIYSERVLANKRFRAEISIKRAESGKLGAELKWLKHNNLIANAKQMPGKSLAKHGKEEKSKVNKIPCELVTETKACIDHFFNKHQETIGTKYHVDGGKDGALMKSLLTTFTQAELIAKIDLFFTSPSDFTKQAGFTIGVFKSQVNKLTAGVKEGKRWLN